MTKRILLLTVLLASSIAAVAQTPAHEAPLAPLKFLVGDWVGEGDGGTGAFSFKFDVQDSVLVRRNHAEYPAKGTQSATVHDDLLVIFKEGNDLRAMYWDNEKHVIRYVVTPNATGAEFVSEKANDAPQFRLTYRKTSDDKLEIAFEIAPPGKPFTPYLKGVAHRVSAK